MAGLSGTAIAGPLEDGMAAYERGDYKTANAIFQPLAVSGNSAAQEVKGYMYQHGQGVEQNDEQAEYWYRKAAIQGRASAQFRLGDMLYWSPKTFTEGFDWIQNAAKRGDANAQNEMGIIFRDGGLGEIKIDFEIAANWFTLAAKKGNVEAQANLRRLLEQGNGAPRK